MAVDKRKRIYMNGVDVTDWFTPTGMRVSYEKITGSNGGTMLSGLRREDIIAYKAKVTLTCMPLTETQQRDFLMATRVDRPSLTYFDPYTKGYRTIYYIADVTETKHRGLAAGFADKWREREFWTGLELTAQEIYAFEITSQPEDYTCAVGQSYSYHVVAVGEDVSYQWYYMLLDDTVTKPSGATAVTKDYTVNTSKATYNGYRFYCIITDKYGNELKSDVVTLTVT